MYVNKLLLNRVQNYGQFIKVRLSFENFYKIILKSFKDKINKQKFFKNNKKVLKIFRQFSKV